MTDKSHPLASLIQDTIAYLKDPLTPRKSYLSSEEEAIFFKPLKTAPIPKREEKSVPTIRSLPPVPTRLHKEPLPPSPQETPPAAKVPEAAAALPEQNLSEIGKVLKKIAPNFPLCEKVPDDAQAVRVANAYKEFLPDVEVVILLCTLHPETVEWIKPLAKAIDEKLGKTKVMTADRLEKEKRWDLFLEKNPIRLIIATAGILSLADLRRYYRKVHTEEFLNQIPLLILSETSVYKDVREKAHLWKTLCQMLKK